MLPAPSVGSRAPFRLPPVERSETGGGLGLQLVEIGGVPKATVRLVLALGATAERPEQRWLAQLLSDYLKEGAGDFNASELADQVSRMGGRLRVHADDDTFTISSAVLSDYAPDFLRLLGDIVRTPLIPPSELGRLTDDLRRNLDLLVAQPSALAAATFRRALYQEHPYGWLLTSPQAIDGFTAGSVREFWAHGASPRGASLSVAGRFDADAVRRATDRAFGDWTGGSPPVVRPAVPTSGRAIHFVDRPGAEQSTLAIGLPVPDPSHENYVALSVTNALLGGSFYSRITLNIREDKGYTYSPRSQIASHPGIAHWVETADVTTAVTGAALTEILQEIERLAATAPTPDELEGIQNYVAGSFVLRNATAAGVLDQLAFLDLHGLPGEWAEHYVERVIAVTAEDIQQIAREYLPHEEMAIAVVGDREVVGEEIARFGPVSEVSPAQLMG